MERFEGVRGVIPSSIPLPDGFITITSYLCYYLQQWFMRIPGASYLIEYIRKSHQDDPYRTIVEIGLIIYGLFYYLSKPWKQGQESQTRLSARDMEQLIAEWEPEPLAQLDSRERWRLAAVPVVNPVKDNGEGCNYFMVSRDGGRECYKNVLNMSSHNYLQLSSHPEVVKVVKKIIQNNGVGSCGPAGFYGNQDVHYNLEYQLADFFGTENAVLYSQDFCVAASVIPAFTKRGDIIVADDQVSVSSQNALQLSRSTVYYFKHNDMKALEEILAELDQREREDRLPAIPRKFILTEGLFHNTGDIAPLPELVKLKKTYFYRLIIDETHSLGVLGRSGRGITENFNINRAAAVDMTIGSTANALGCSGGLVLGDNVMSYHQRISSNAYCFSASLPPYGAAAAQKILQIMEKDNSTVTRLQELSAILHKTFADNLRLRKYIKIPSSPLSPVLHIQISEYVRKKLFNSSINLLFNELSTLNSRYLTKKYVHAWDSEERFLQKIVSVVLDKGVLISRNTVVHKHETLPIVPSLKIICHANLTKSELLNSCTIISDSILQEVELALDLSSDTNLKFLDT